MEIITDKKRNNIFLKELKENIDKVDDIDKSHYTCLSTAVSYKIFEAVKLLLDKGADVYHKNNDRKTPLFYAYFSPNEQVIKSK
jgi:ankyrin repeat protein